MECGEELGQLLAAELFAQQCLAVAVLAMLCLPRSMPMSVTSFMMASVSNENTLEA
jgi:hypothetical protein